AVPDQRADAVGVVHFKLVETDTAAPDIDLVQQGVGKGHELPVDRAAARCQVRAPAPVRQVALVVPGAVAGVTTEQVEIQHDQVQQGRHGAAAQQAHHADGELH